MWPHINSTLTPEKGCEPTVMGCNLQSVFITFEQQQNSELKNCLIAHHSAGWPDMESFGSPARKHLLSNSFPTFYDLTVYICSSERGLKSRYASNKSRWSETTMNISFYIAYWKCHRKWKVSHWRPLLMLLVTGNLGMRDILLFVVHFFMTYNTIFNM